MKQVKIGQSNLYGSEVIMGTFRVEYLDEDKEVERFIKSTLDVGINFLDNSDLYGRTAPHGFSDARVGKVLNFKENSKLREQMIIQTKFGFGFGKKAMDGSELAMKDSSRSAILSSVEGSLKRLGTDYLDILLFHSPDIFMDPEEVADTFNELQKSGKVRYFGVSNTLPSRIEVLNKYLKTPIVVNQIHMNMVDGALFDYVNNLHCFDGLDPLYDAGAGTLDYCKLKDIQIQAWSPLTYHDKPASKRNPELHHLFLPFVGDYRRFHRLNCTLDKIAEKYNVPKMSIVLSWFLSHPYHIAPTIGTTSDAHIREIAQASEVRITREEWYDIFQAAKAAR